MRIISQGRIYEYCGQYPEAKGPLLSFMKIARKAEWQHLQDLRRSYPHADAVKASSGKTVTVLNVCGNRYRLIVAAHYNRGVLFVLRFLTHAEYDKERWKESL